MHVCNTSLNFRGITLYRAFQFYKTEVFSFCSVFELRDCLGDSQPLDFILIKKGIGQAFKEFTLCAGAC